MNKNKSIKITIKNGTLVGTCTQKDGISSFKGIPYAQPPVGELRWKAPQPPKNWMGELDATKYATKAWAAPVYGGTIDPTELSEDCLYLNIWTPSLEKANLPVMVFIHGGGFQFGTGSDDAHDGASIAKKGVILITINYRLGVFGYLSLPQLDEESNGQKSGMYGILDQIAALRWIKENISAFGGDSNNVTIFGESAGAHSVGILMASPIAKGLFHKAIGQSGAFWESENGTMKSKKDAEKLGEVLLKKLEVQTLNELRKIAPMDLMNATPWSISLDPSISNFSPNVDGYVLPSSPCEQFLKGKQNDVPLLVGWNADEGRMFWDRAIQSKTIDEYKKVISNIFGKEHLEEFLELYPISSNDEISNSENILNGDQVISFQTWSWANIHRKTGLSSVYVYYFNLSSKYTPIPIHTADVGYVFGILREKNHVMPSVIDWDLSDAMQNYWSNFAKFGNPNGKELPFWPKYNGPNSLVMKLGNKIIAEVEEGTNRFEFLERFRINGILNINKSII